eukprot:4925879-Amphidinium_carterae.1
MKTLITLASLKPHGVAVPLALASASRVNGTAGLHKNSSWHVMEQKTNRTEVWNPCVCKQGETPFWQITCHMTCSPPESQ